MSLTYLQNNESSLTLQIKLMNWADQSSNQLQVGKKLQHGDRLEMSSVQPQYLYMMFTKSFQTGGGPLYAMTWLVDFLMIGTLGELQPMYSRACKKKTKLSAGHPVR